jgi:hypothetical protein
MPDFERTTTVGLGADAAYEILADPLRLPEYAPTIRHVETEVVDGELDPNPDSGSTATTGEGRFFADKSTHRVEWAVPNAGYEGSIEVAEGTASTSQVTLRVRTIDEGGAAEVERMLDETIRNVRRLLSRR